MQHNKHPVVGNPASNHWVLGAGGWKLFFHIGVLQAAEELDATLDSVLGVSCGALVGAFATNGYKAAQITPIFMDLRKSRWNPRVLMRMLAVPDFAAYPKLLNITDPCSAWSCIFFTGVPFMQALVKEYGLRPNSRLRLLACDIANNKRQPFIFEGEDYDLATGLAASGAIPGIVQPVRYNDGTREALLIDGALYHFNPTEFSPEPGIVSNLPRATRMPEDWQIPADLYFAWREINMPLVHGNDHVDAERHIVIRSGLPDVAGLNVGMSDETCRRMVETGYTSARPVLEKAIALGQVRVQGTPSHL